MHRRLFFRTGLAGLALAAVVAGLVLGSGCELRSADNKVVISPATAVLRRGQSVTLTASGGYYYHWSLSAEEWGLLSDRYGSQVVYTSLVSPATNENPFVQVVQVVSSFTDSSGSSGATSTNSPSGVTNRAEALVTHLP